MKRGILYPIATTFYMDRSRGIRKKKITHERMKIKSISALYIHRERRVIPEERVKSSIYYIALQSPAIVTRTL